MVLKYEVGNIVLFLPGFALDWLTNGEHSNFRTMVPGMVGLNSASSDEN